MTGRFTSLLPGALVVFLSLLSLPLQFRAALQRLRDAPSWLSRNETAALRALRGNAYADTIAKASTLIPPEGTYAIADRGQPVPVRHWVRCDLAPRAPVWLRPGACGEWRFDRTVGSIPAWTLVVDPDETIRIVATAQLMGTLWSGLEGREDDTIPGWLDFPENGARVRAPIAVSGWCEERGIGARPCRVRVWIDGREIPSSRIERFPRPDVCAAVPGLGSCRESGWRVHVSEHEISEGIHCAAAALVASDDRFRKIGPWPFEASR